MLLEPSWSNNLSIMPPFGGPSLQHTSFVGNTSYSNYNTQQVVVGTT
jgi:hypothetical protein